MNVSAARHVAKLFLKKNSAIILVTAGAVGTVAAAVIAAKKTKKLEKTKEKAKAFIEEVREEKPAEEIAVKQPDVKKTYQMKLVKAYGKAGFQYVKLYALPVSIELVSLGMIFSGYGIVHHRYMAVSAAAAGIEESFAQYRNRVKAKFGEEADKLLMTDGSTAEVPDMLEDGTGPKYELYEGMTRESHLSPYARLFDEYNAPETWTKNTYANKGLTLSVLQWANQTLKNRGYLFLNEVYDRFGFQRSKAGYAVGWIYDPDDPNHKGANMVDFGLDGPFQSERTKAFNNGYEPAVWLDFNVDGIITDKVGAMLPKF